MKTVPDMVHLMQSWRVEYLISPKLEKAKAVEPELLQEMLEYCTEPIFQQGGEYLARLEPGAAAGARRTPGASGKLRRFRTPRCCIAAIGATTEPTTSRTRTP